MKWRNKISDYLILIIGCLLSLSIFIVDFFTPVGIGNYFLYITILLFFMLTNKKSYIVLWCVITIVFIIIGYLVSPENPDISVSIAISNRLISISLILIVTVGTVKFLKNRLELLDKVNELARTNKELESFIYLSSHDIQEPLRKILINSSILSEEEHLSEHGKFYLEKMANASKEMRMKIDDLLQYSTLKNVIPEFEKTDINIIVEKAVTKFKESIDEKNGIVKFEGDCEARVDRHQFYQLFTNLLQNSIKFSDPDKNLQIIVQYDCDDGSKLNPKLSSGIKYCHISFIDNGFGFDPQYNDRIFNFFERLHGQKYPGTGLGLTICKRIIENHSGIITATGELNKGARFDIYIPIDRPESKNQNGIALFT